MEKLSPETEKNPVRTFRKRQCNRFGNYREWYSLCAKCKRFL